MVIDMAKKNDVAVEKTVQEVKYKGSQLLKTDAFNTRVGRLVLDPNEFYSVAEAEKLIKKY